LYTFPPVILYQWSEDDPLRSEQVAKLKIRRWLFWRLFIALVIVTNTRVAMYV